MTDLAALTDEDFAPHSGSSFRLHLAGAGEPLDLELVEITTGGQTPGQNRRSFSLVFRGPRSPWLRQGNYRLEHASMGALELFMVPINPDSQGPLYQAVFT